MGYARQSKSRLSCSSMPGVEFDTAEPPEVSREIEYRYRKPGKDGKERRTGEIMYGDVSATGWISTTEHLDLRADLNKGDLTAHDDGTLTFFDMDDDDVPIPGTEKSYVASLKSYKEDGLDANGTDNIRFNAVWAIKGPVG